MNYPVPILRIEVEGVKHAILQYLQASEQEFGRIVEEELSAIDIEALIRLEVRQAVPRMVQDIVTQTVENLTRRIITEARWGGEMGEVVRAAIDDAAKRVLNPSTGI